MKTEDFEKAIDALNCAIEIDEMKIGGGNVRRAFAHGDHILLMWDEYGRGFCIDGLADGEPFNSESHEGRDQSEYSRSVTYDLKFE